LKKNFNLADESRSPFKTIMILAWPLFIEQVLSTLVHYVDSAMVGQLGAYATAAVSISNPVFMLMNGAVMAFGVGLTAMIAQSIGAGDIARVKKIMYHGLMIPIFLGIPLLILLASLAEWIPTFMGAAEDVVHYGAQYNMILAMSRPFIVASMLFNSAMRGAGDTKTPMYINLIANLLNVLGNFFLISAEPTISLFGFRFTFIGAGLGVAGAAISTSASLIVGGIISTVIVFRKESPIRISLKNREKLDKDLFKQLFSISTPAMLERFCMNGASIVVTKSIATLGTVAVAANSLYATAESLSYMPAFSFASAVTTLVGQSLGAGKPKLAKTFIKQTTLIGIVLMIFTGIGLYAFADPLISFFTKDAEVIRLASDCLRLQAFFQAFQSTSWIFAGALRGAGDTRTPFYVTAVTTWGVRAAGTMIAITYFGAGLMASLWFIFADITIRAIAFGITLMRGRWIHAKNM